SSRAVTKIATPSRTVAVPTSCRPGNNNTSLRSPGSDDVIVSARIVK
ncbi:hypothetical protein GBAR_LOCUS12676, partial [Geodia barretti]